MSGGEGLDQQAKEDEQQREACPQQRERREAGIECPQHLAVGEGEVLIEGTRSGVTTCIERQGPSGTQRPDKSHQYDERSSGPGRPGDEGAHECDGDNGPDRQCLGDDMGRRQGRLAQKDDPTSLANRRVGRRGLARTFSIRWTGHRRSSCLLRS